jgi:HD-GYP domain-containing protein (c-di-GMP phosphodiesterase class II)
VRDRHTYVNVRPYLPHALLATLAVIGLPFLAVFALVRTMEPDPHVAMIAIVALMTALVVSAAGVALWKTRPESADIAFGELLIWGWLQRKRADDRLDEGAALLGLDRSGHPTDGVRISPDDQLQVLQDLNSALELKDPYTHGHSQRVERHSYRTAAAMGLPVDSIEELRLAARLHDVGKIRVPDRVLRKPGKLDKEERLIVEEHVVVGAWMVSSVGSADVVSSVRHHHERWDGAGYPDGLAGTDIPLYARIIAVADAYDAITSTRPYRVSAGREHAVSILRSEAGSQFDPMIVNSFIDALPVRLPVAGALVLMSGPIALGRRLALWLKRVGAGHLAPAAATLGAIVTLGSFMPAPIVPSTAPPIVAQESSTQLVEERSGDSVRPPRSRVTKVTTTLRPSENVVVASAAEPRFEQDIVLGDTLVRPDGARPPVAPRPDRPLPSGPKPDPAPTTEPTPAPEPTPSNEPQPQPEPQPEPTPTDGADDADDDCSHEDGEQRKGKGHDKAKGEGHSKHCD